MLKHDVVDNRKTHKTFDRILQYCLDPINLFPARTYAVIFHGQCWTESVKIVQMFEPKSSYFRKELGLSRECKPTLVDSV